MVKVSQQIGSSGVVCPKNFPCMMGRRQDLPGIGHRPCSGRFSLGISKQIGQSSLLAMAKLSDK